MNNDFPSILNRAQYITLLAGIASMVIGFALMVGGGSENPNVFAKETLFSFQRITLAPFLVMLGFGISGVGIFYRKKQ
jgi:hypothetical protein